MSDKLVVPEGMLKAAIAAVSADPLPMDRYRVFLEAALGWLAENPIVPTDEQGLELEQKWRTSKPNKTCAAWCAGEWQRRMFLQTEPREGQ